MSNAVKQVRVLGSSTDLTGGNMKTLIAVLFSMMLATSLSAGAEAEMHSKASGQNMQMMAMMNDPDSRSQMMDHIAGDPEMRHEMMQKMMQSMQMDMQQMMNSPEMQERMQKHVKMMQAMMGPEGMDQAKMKEMMDDPEMKEMMQMHMMGMQMMNAGMMGEHSTEESEEHAH